eukprot:9491102-Pyramimonas_sp.AAC.1
MRAAKNHSCVVSASGTANSSVPLSTGCSLPSASPALTPVPLPDSDSPLQAAPHSVDEHRVGSFALALNDSQNVTFCFPVRLIRFTGAPSVEPAPASVWRSPMRAPCKDGDAPPSPPLDRFPSVRGGDGVDLGGPCGLSPDIRAPSGDPPSSVPSRVAPPDDQCPAGALGGADGEAGSLEAAPPRVAFALRS